MFVLGMPEKMVTKRCTNCGAMKRLAEFPKKAKGKHGVGSWCSRCARMFGRGLAAGSKGTALEAAEAAVVERDGFELLAEQVIFGAGWKSGRARWVAAHPDAPPVPVGEPFAPEPPATPAPAEEEPMPAPSPAPPALRPNLTQEIATLLGEVDGVKALLGDLQFASDALDTCLAVQAVAGWTETELGVLAGPLLAKIDCVKRCMAEIREALGPRGTA